MNHPYSSIPTNAQEPDGDLECLDGDDFDLELRQAFLREAIPMRQGNPLALQGVFSKAYVLEAAAARCFELMAMELRALDGLLTEDELTAILNATRNPVWSWSYRVSLAGPVADEYGIETLEDESPMTSLVRKLTQLTSSQSLALVDLCERIWRNPVNRPIRDIAAELGLQLA